MRRFLPYISIGIFIFTLLSGLSNFTKNATDVSLGEALSKIDTQKITKVNVLNDSVILKLDDGSKVKSAIPGSYIPFLIKDLKDKNLNFDFMAIEGQRSLIERVGGFLGFLISWLPMIVISWLILSPFFNRGGDDKNKKGGSNSTFGGFMGTGNPFNFGKSKARAISPADLKVTFDDVQGIDEAKQDIEELVDFLKDPMKYQNLGGRIPRGCLLIGQPGTGKTLLAKAIASEAKVPFFFISGSDFVEMFVGVGASRVRDMFSQAKTEAPCIVFIDEIDAVGRHRGVGIGGGNDEREQTLNQLLVEMDGFGENSGVVVLAATNRPDVLDTALLRPGRFDRQIYVNLPDIKGREKILSVHAKKTKLSHDVTLVTIAKGTPGFSGADLANLINEAALLAAKRNHKVITMRELEDAKDKILMGGERNLMMKEEERKLTAYHEAGHAIVSINLPHSDPVHKATIIPRGRALGMVMRLPETDRVSMTRAKLKADMTVAMGGRVAEEMIFGYDSVTSGASSDIEQATKIATHMVIKWGLSDKIGNVNYGDEDGKISDKVSEDVKASIDQEIKKFVDEAFTLAKKILKQNEENLHLLAQNLLKYETLTGEEINTLIKEKKDIRENNDVDMKIKKNKEKKGSVFSRRKKKTDE